MENVVDPPDFREDNETSSNVPPGADLIFDPKGDIYVDDGEQGWVDLLSPYIDYVHKLSCLGILIVWDKCSQEKMAVKEEGIDLPFNKSYHLPPLLRVTIPARMVTRHASHSLFHRSIRACKQASKRKRIR